MNDRQVTLARQATILTFDEMLKVGEQLAKSNYFKGVTTPAQALAKVMAGAELGIPPFAAMSGIHIIEGKVVMGSTLMAGLIRKSGVYDYRVDDITNDICKISFYEVVIREGARSMNSIGVSTFTWKDAESAGLTSKAVWKSYTRNMLFARALSNGIRFYTPDLFLGAPVYTAEELDQPTNEDGGYIETTMVGSKMLADWWDVFSTGVKERGYTREQVSEALACEVAKIRIEARRWLEEHATADPAADVGALLAFIGEKSKPAEAEVPEAPEAAQAGAPAALEPDAVLPPSDAGAKQAGLA